MELFWKILPFLIPLIIVAGMYRDYKNQDAVKIEKPPSWLQRQEWYQYIKLVFYTRPQHYRPSSLVWYYPMVICLFFGVGSFVVNIQNLIYPPLPLEKMQTQQGIIESITLRKKMDDLLVLRRYDGVREEYAYRIYEPADKFIDKNVTVYYHRGFSSAFSIDNQIHQIITNDTHTILDPLPYDYERYLRNGRGFWNFTKYLFYIAAFSAFMLWRANRKELPIHRLNRMKLNKKIWVKGTKFSS